MVSPNQMRLLAQSSSPEILAHVKTIWGAVQSKVSEQRQKVVEQKTAFLLNEARGDAKRGLAVYDRICGQCHLLHGRGYEVGPNITANGRGNFEQLIVSVFDPSLVIGEAYKSYTLLTVDGRVLNGLLVEQTPQRTVLRLQGNKQETIPADEIEEFKQNDKSLMPEGLEEQMTAQELADLFRPPLTRRPRRREGESCDSRHTGHITSISRVSSKHSSPSLYLHPQSIQYWERHRRLHKNLSAIQTMMRTAQRQPVRALRNANYCAASSVRASLHFHRQSVD
jgi:putative heme-binding domain-containing protein